MFFHFLSRSLCSRRLRERELLLPLTLVDLTRRCRAFDDAQRRKMATSGAERKRCVARRGATRAHAVDRRQKRDDALDVCSFYSDEFFMQMT